MTEYSFDNQSLFRDGKRWFPVMGEMHYSRVPEAEWKDELLKMKEGGIDIVSSYVIWIHHEEIENEFDWNGQRNLRAFVEEIKNAGLAMVLRIGPWSHAEARNGGFPDWLISKCPKYRSNDEAYFSEVEKFYSQIFE
ncbi:MAG: beta-galactosidase, partial [Treponema sp.]|nr:beta-galactosidase [Treponema sp.]